MESSTELVSNRETRNWRGGGWDVRENPNIPWGTDAVSSIWGLVQESLPFKIEASFEEANSVCCWAHLGLMLLPLGCLGQSLAPSLTSSHGPLKNSWNREVVSSQGCVVSYRRSAAGENNSEASNPMKRKHGVSHHMFRDIWGVMEGLFSALKSISTNVLAGPHVEPSQQGLRVTMTTWHHCQ